jgi:hypothetical protein
MLHCGEYVKLQFFPESIKGADSTEDVDLHGASGKWVVHPDNPKAIFPLHLKTNQRPQVLLVVGYLWFFVDTHCHNVIQKTQ